MAIGDHENPNQELKPRNRKFMEAGEFEEEEIQWPLWLKPLLKEHFFGQCHFHYGHSSKSECNMYCLDCANDSLCSFCLAPHNGHRTIQIRRSSYHDVIRVSEIQKHLDISIIQTFVINGAKVVFLNERPPPKPAKGVTNTCEVCYRSLQDVGFRFCSIGCKVVGTSRSFKKRVKHTQIETEDSSNSSGVSGIENNSSNLQSSSPSPPPQLPNSGLKRQRLRRKGIPHRAPFS